MAEASGGKPAVRGMLAGIRIVEYGDGIPAAFATRLLTDHGAEVIKVEPLNGDSSRRRGPFPADQVDPEKSGIFLYLNTNKRGVTLDLTKPEGRAIFDRLLERADVLVHNVRPSGRASLGLESADLSHRHPSLIITAISPFGDHGPHADYKAYELTVANASGWAFLSPGASPYPELPPLKPFGSQHELQGGVHAAMTTLGAYFHRLKSGKGQAIEVSEQECVSAMLEMNFMHWTYAGRETSRCGNRLIGPWTMLDCADGKIFVVTVEEDQWQRLVELMGNPEWAQEELFKDRLARGANGDALHALMGEWASTWKVRDLFHEGQKRRIPFAAVNRMGDIYGDEQLRERGFFIDIPHPVAGNYKMPGTPLRSPFAEYAVRRPAPRLGEHVEEVFCGELGLSRDELARLRQAKAG